MIDNKQLFTHIESLYEHTVDIRRTIHKNPELSGQEHQTARLIFHELESLGLQAKMYAGNTGVAAKWTNGEGKTLVLRADIDALPVEEVNDLPYCSQNPGVMHACGHDMHTAMLLGAARLLKTLQDQWRGTVVFLFQPSEEVEPGGALRMIKEKAFPSKVDAIFGMHVSADHTTGQVGIKSGDDFSGILVFDACVKGRGGHGATPEETVDPIVCASSMIVALQTLISRESPPFEPAVLTIGKIQAGTKRNVIPDEARFYGTIRTFSETLQKNLETRLKQLLKGVAQSFRAHIELQIEHSYPSGYNDPDLTSRAQVAFAELLGDNQVITRPHPTMYSEDFAYYQRKAPGLYVHLGVRPPNKKNMPGIHSSQFLPDESAIRYGMALHAGMVLDFLAR
ncbi:MAG: M20 metallopeptidase family protein [Chitinivibrionales bacterium]